MADNLHEQPFGNETLTAGHLFDELVAIANINQSFRQGRQDYMHVFVETSDTPSLDGVRMGNETDESVIGRLVDENTGEVDWPSDYSGMTFSLEAKRRFECTIDERNIKLIRQHLLITYVMTTMTKNIPVLPNIATVAYGIDDPDEAVENAGKSQRDDIKVISISTKDFTPSVCEATVWRDSEDADVSVSHSCQDPDCDFYKTDDDYVQQVLIQTDSTGLMKVADDLAKAHVDNIPETKEVKTKEDDIVSQFDWEGFERVNKVINRNVT